MRFLSNLTFCDSQSQGEITKILYLTLTCYDVFNTEGFVATSVYFSVPIIDMHVKTS